jgi:hypothetical protein
MSNVFERHPGYTLLFVIIAVMTATWGILTFVLEDNKLNFYKAQVESVKAETENIKATNLLYLAKIEYLENENRMLAALNNSYLDWIEKTPNPLPFLKARIEELSKENHKLLNNYSDSIGQMRHKSILGTPNTDNTVIVSKNYEIIKEIKKGEAYVDKVTGIIVGVENISVDYQSNLQITFPDNTTKKEQITAGKSYSFTSMRKKYQLIVRKVEFVYGYVTIQILEK